MQNQVLYSGAKVDSLIEVQIAFTCIPQWFKALLMLMCAVHRRMKER